MLDFDELGNAFDRDLQKFINSLNESTPRGFMQFFEKSRQPNLARMIASEYFNSMGDLPKKDQPRPEAQSTLAVLSKVMIDEPDKLLRK